jgi:hypothetical protein
MWKFVRVLIPMILFSIVGPNAARADCQIGDARLEEAILQNPKFRGPLTAKVSATFVACETRHLPYGRMAVWRTASAFSTTSAR